MKMDRLCFTFLFVLLGAIVSGGCQVAQVEVVASGKDVTETRSVSSFHAVHADGNGHLVIDRTGTESFQITMDDRLLPYLQIEVSNGTLYVRPKPNVSLINDRGYTVTLTVQTLDGLTLNGNSNAVVRGIDTPQWKASLNGNNFAKLAGRAVRQEITSAGNVVYDAQALESEQAVVRAEGNSNIIVRVSDELDATVKGLARVGYIGTPFVREKVEDMASVQQHAVQ